MKHFTVTAAFALLIGQAAPATAAPVDDLNAVIEAHWEAFLTHNPVSASQTGDRRGDGQLGDMSLKGLEREAEQARDFARRLRAIPDVALPPADRVNRQVLLTLLDERIEGDRFGQRLMLFTSYSNWHQSFADLPRSLPFDNATDYQSWLDRMAAYPAYNRAAMAVTARASEQGYVQPCAALSGFGESIASVAAMPVEETPFFAPFKRARPRDLGEGDWTAMQAKARILIADKVLPAYRDWHAWYQGTYWPQCRKSIGASAMPDGTNWYAFRARAETTTTLTPDAIHRIGLDEVKRISARMDMLAKASGHSDRTAMIAALRADPASYVTSPETLLRLAARTAKRIDGLLPRYFGTLPRLPYGVGEIPAAIAPMTTTAYYMPGAPGIGVAGTYYVNTSKLDQRPVWEYPALTAHEAVPGHHLQIAMQQELTLPQFRRYGAGFTAFTEGWGLYAEYLGEEMGLYDTPETMMGRLSYEMWRACRLVVDTGLHAKGWSKEQAVAYMRTNTALSDANIEAEVNRYISWPGQALGYKIGEIRIREARAKAEAALGPKFKLTAFHDLILGMGAVPLDVMSAEVDRWIEAQRGK